MKFPFPISSLPWRIGFLVLLLTSATTSARALVFDFVIVGSGGGTVEGTLTGLVNDADNQIPTVTITNSDGLFSDPYTFLSSYSDGTGFSVHGETITAASFSIQDYYSGGEGFPEVRNYANFNSRYESANGIAFFNYDTLDAFEILNRSGFSGATYTLASPVPEPSDYGWVLAVVVACVAGWRRFSLP